VSRYSYTNGLDNKSQNRYKMIMETGWKVEFLNDTAEAEFDGLPTEIKAKIIRISQLIEQVGVFSVKEPYVRHLQGKIWEIRASGKEKVARALYTTVTGKRVIIVRTFVKKTRKTPKREIEIARQRIMEFNHGEKTGR
jgi:phage-related protein